MGELKEEHKGVHSFFNKLPKPTPTQSDDHPKHKSHTLASISSSILIQAPLPPGSEDKDNSTPLHFLEQPLDMSDEDVFVVDPNSSRRKRQKTVLKGRKRRLGGGNGSIENLISPNPPGDTSTIPQPNGILAFTGGKLRLLNPKKARVSSKPADSSNAATNSNSNNKSSLTTSGFTVQGQAVKDVQNSDQKSSETSIDHPRKILRLNSKTGTIGSPPSKSSSSTDILSKTKPMRRGKQNKLRLVCIAYSAKERSNLGHRINAILAGEERIQQIFEKSDKDNLQIPSNSSSTSMSHSIANVSVPLRQTHPFFQEKRNTAVSSTTSTSKKSHPFFAAKVPTEVTSVPANANRILSQDSPVFLRQGSHLAQASTISAWPVSSFTGSKTNSKLVKFPGAIEPAWPWHGMNHVRGIEGLAKALPNADFRNADLGRKSSKSKYRAIEVTTMEYVVNAVAKDLRIGEFIKNIYKTNPNLYTPAPDCLRIPNQHFESGYSIQRRILDQLHARLPPPRTDHSSDDELQSSVSRPIRAHPALRKRYESIASTLSSFDRLKCATKSWTHKYAPSCAEDVLQTGKEALMLKEWLERLTISSVSTGVAEKLGVRSTTLGKSTMGKRKRRSKKLDGFVVSSDEDGDDLESISEPEDDIFRIIPGESHRKTVVRTTDVSVKESGASIKLANAVIMSGPYGCGKTAAVYAVAKELDFEVFEINSSTRRNGKDILEKVGDMSRNHLVQQRRDTSIPSFDEETQISETLAEITTGRQGTMNSFFKIKSTKTSSEVSDQNLVVNLDNKEETKKTTSDSTRRQKQSLILFEEADILYEEDRQFWTTVMSLITQSKRPVVITCSDESLIPIPSSSLHAILRFIPPPVDLAADYLLAIAANEGHCIQRDAVEALYKNRHSDLRASIMELDFWCQFTVGDRRGGLDWLYPRFPAGSDVDKDGNTIRVVSEGTYQKGMGWLSQDTLHSSTMLVEEQLLHECNEHWQLDLSDWHNTTDISGWAREKRTQSNTNNLEALSMYEDFVFDMSDADICSNGTFAIKNYEALDATLPTLSAVDRQDYTIGYELLEANPIVKYEPLDIDISMWLKCHARSRLQTEQHLRQQWPVPTELSCPKENRILELLSSESPPERQLTRLNLSLAFDPISAAENVPSFFANHLEPSCFDRTMTLITTEIAPYVRSIVEYDTRLQQERTKMSNLLSEGGRLGKRMRTTRAALSALEGGTRNTTRRDKYFSPDLNPHLVLKTGKREWLDAVRALGNEGEDRERGGRAGSGEKDELLSSSPSG